MQVFEFISELELHFPISGKVEQKTKLIKSYVDNITEFLQGKEDKYDLQKVLHYLVINRKYKSLPALAEIFEAMPYGLPGDGGYTPCENEGKVIIATLPSGYKYLFEISGIGKSIEQIKASLFKRFGQCTVKMYPGGTCLIGNSIYVPDEETQEQSIKQGSLL